MDHQYSQVNSYIETILDMPAYEECINEIDDENTTIISVPEKTGDNYLIQLYRERKFLYDKSHRNFKDNELKNNTWKEISSIMKDKNLGDYYTPDYCKKRITNLREQYVKLKKEQTFKSGSAACTTKKSALLSELSFLDVYIKRRRTLTNIKENIEKVPVVSCKRNIDYPEGDITESINLNKKISELLPSQDNLKDDSTKNLCEQKPSKIFKTSAASKKNNDDDVLLDLTNAAMNIVTQLQSDSSSTENISSTSVEHAFAQFIALSLEKMEEPERTVRRNKILHDLTIPLEHLM